MPPGDDWRRKQGEQESSEGFIRRVDGVIHAVRARVRTLPLAIQACCLYFGWAGHLARLPEDRAITKMVRWHALDNFRHSQILGVDVDGTPRRRMARSGRPTRWEDVLESLVGPQWLLDGVSRGGVGLQEGSPGDLGLVRDCESSSGLLVGMAGDSPHLKEFEHHPAGHWLRLGSPPYLYRGQYAGVLSVQWHLERAGGQTLS